MYVGVKYVMRYILIINWGSGVLWYWILWDVERGVGEGEIVIFFVRKRFVFVVLKGK